MPVVEGMKRRWSYFRTTISLLRQFGPSQKVRLHGVEVGVYRGELSATLLERFPNLHLTMVDVWDTFPGQAQKENFELTMQHVAKYWPRWNVMKCDSVSAAAHLSAANLKFDFVFIDANHSYEFVKEDIEVWWPRVKPGGLFCGHDYHGHFGGVDKAVDEFAASVQLPVLGHKGHVWEIRRPKHAWM